MLFAHCGLRLREKNPPRLAHFSGLHDIQETWNGVVVNALRYKSEGPEMDSRCCRGFFLGIWQFHWLGSTQTLKVSSSISLGVKAAGV